MSVKVQVSLCVCTAAVEMFPLLDCACFDSEWHLFLGTLNRKEKNVICVFIDLRLEEILEFMDA